MATIPTNRASYQHPTFSSTKEHPLSKQQQAALKELSETIERMQYQTRNKAALILRLRTFNDNIAAFRKALSANNL